MRALFKAVLFFVLPAAQAMAEPLSFSFSAGSGAYLVEVLFPQPPEDRKQLAPAVITVRNPATQDVLQQLQTQAGNIPLDRDGKDNGWMLGRFSLVYFDDFNFDGRLDLAIRNGDDPEVAYKGNYDVYLQDPQSSQWGLNRALTNLAKESNGGMFAVIPNENLFSQTDRDGHWTRTCRWRMQGDELVRLHCDTEDNIQPTEYDDTSSMPRGYTRRTVGDWRDGQWHEQSTLDGPASEDRSCLSAACKTMSRWRSGTRSRARWSLEKYATSRQPAPSQSGWWGLGKTRATTNSSTSANMPMTAGGSANGASPGNRSILTHT